MRYDRSGKRRNGGGKREERCMKIAGIQKLTLLDYPGKVAGIIFTDRCNLRCPFCHNAALVTHEAGDGIGEGELSEFLEKRAGLLEGMVITGGEPLIYPDVAVLMRKIKSLGYSVKLDTNGTEPELLRSIIDEGLCDYVAMDIKNSLAAYPMTVGLANIDTDRIVRSAELLMSCGIEYEFRTTVVKGIHTVESMTALAKEIAGAKKYFLQQFKNSGDLISPYGLSAFGADEMRTIADAVRPYVPSVELRGI